MIAVHAAIAASVVRVLMADHVLRSLLVRATCEFPLLDAAGSMAVICECRRPACWANPGNPLSIPRWGRNRRASSVPERIPSFAVDEGSAASTVFRRRCWLGADLSVRCRRVRDGSLAGSQ